MHLDELINDATRGARNVEESVVAFVRGFAQKVEAACNENDWNLVRGLVGEAHSRAPEVAAAVADDGSGTTRDQRVEPQPGEAGGMRQPGEPVGQPNPESPPLQTPVGEAGPVTSGGDVMDDSSPPTR